MPSTTLSRRRLLAAGGSCLSVAIAGCSGVESGRTVEGDGTDAGGRVAESTHEYEVLTVRASDDDPFVYPNEDEAERDADRPRRHTRSFFVIDDADADALRIDRAENASEATEIRTFLEDTDFEVESIVVDQRPIGDCYRRRLLSVQAMDDEFSQQYCRTLKDPMTSCEAERDLMEASFIRVHRPYEEAPSSRSMTESASRQGRIDAAPNESETAATETESSDTEATDSETKVRE